MREGELVEFKMAARDDEFLQYLLADDEEDAVLLHLLPQHKQQTYDPMKPKFELQDLTSAQCKSFFRFEKGDLYKLADCLRIPERIVLQNRCVVSGIDALCILLRRFAYPNRLLDLEMFFNRPKTTLSMIISEMVTIIYDNYNEKLTDMNQQWIQQRLQLYADTIHRRGAPLTNCVGFIDGTVRAICRPGQFQRVCFNGHKRIHSIKFQSVVSPDGMIMNLYGPLEGRRHDCALLRYSGLLGQFEQGQWRDRHGQLFCLYGDPAYPVRDYLIAPYRDNAVLDQWQQEFNVRMSSVREAVEWQFGKIATQFAFLDFRKNMKLFLQPVGKMYIVGALLTNCHSCIYGSITGSYFGLQAPAIDEYLQ